MTAIRTGFGTAVRWILTGALAFAGAGALASQPRAGATRHQVSMQGMAFKPARVEVAVGDTVAWTNQDIVPHTATADGPGAWDTGALSQGRGAVHVPTQPGQFRYYCALHPTMEGTLIVK